MAKPREIWVLPEINSREEEISKLSLGLLSEANSIAEKVGGTVTALVFSDQGHDSSEVFGQYGVTSAYSFKDPVLEFFSAEAYSAALLPEIRKDKPWLFLMGNTTIGRELAPRLVALLETGLVTNCARMDFSDLDRPVFFRPVYGDQLYQEVIFQTSQTMLVTMDPTVLNITPLSKSSKVKSSVIESGLSPDTIRAKHLDFLPADFKTVDVVDANVVVSAGMGAATAELLPLVEELAGLIEGTIGTTRPVVDGGKIHRERMIGQTGKVISPEFYLALGISGATHHIGGIQGSERIVSINRDPRAPIFQNSDVGVAADLREVLPILKEKIKQAKTDGTIL
ncbi:electron transfer flavoprotein subunit alpha/FixB family protein [Chloroflexota bacterium]